MAETVGSALVERRYRLANLSPEMQHAVRLACHETCHREAPRAAPCVESGHACARCQQKARTLTQGEEK